MDSSLDKTLALINGQSPSEYEATQLTDADRAQIENAIDVAINYFEKNFEPGILELFTEEIGLSDEELEGLFKKVTKK